LVYGNCSQWRFSFHFVHEQTPPHTHTIRSDLWLIRDWILATNKRGLKLSQREIDLMPHKRQHIQFHLYCTVFCFFFHLNLLATYFPPPLADNFTKEWLLNEAEEDLAKSHHHRLSRETADLYLSLPLSTHYSC